MAHSAVDSHPVFAFSPADSERPLLGVLGGMGPAATLDFLAKLQGLANASCDQDHCPVVTFSASETPDRTAAILGTGESPLPAMQDALKGWSGPGPAMSPSRATPPTTGLMRFRPAPGCG